MSRESIDRLFDSVVKGGYCVGCGACAAVAGSGIRMALDEYGRLQAVRAASPANDISTDVERVCPFSEKATDEDSLAESLFGIDAARDERFGRYRGLYAGHAQPEFRARGSSGGMGSWILAELLEHGLVDAVLHVRPRACTPDDPRLFAFAVSRSVDDLRRGAKSHYYPVEMSDVLRTVIAEPGRYAITGVPCFIKAVRLLARENPLLAERIRYCVALVCGHLKTAGYAQSLAWQCGVAPDALRRLDFRVKLPGQGADEYGTEAEGERDGEPCRGSAPTRSLYGTDWGLGFFKYKACDYCDDVVGETADVSIGDAWLPQYAWDPNGTNVVIVRNAELDELLRSGTADGRLSLDILAPADVARSQAGGLFHRRQGLAYRLHLARERGEWHPPKRVRPGMDHLDARERAKHALRPQLSEQSHEAFRKAVAAGDFDLFRREMEPWVRRYRAVVVPAWKRLLQPAVRRLRSVRNRLRRLRG